MAEGLTSSNGMLCNDKLESRVISVLEDLSGEYTVMDPTEMFVKSFSRSRLDPAIIESFIFVA